MAITKEEIIHLAELSKLSMSDAEIVSLQGDIERILDYVRELDELDVSGVEPTYSPFSGENVWREDEIVEFEASRDELLALSKETQDNQIKIPKVL